MAVLTKEARPFNLTAMFTGSDRGKLGAGNSGSAASLTTTGWPMFR